MGVAADGLLVRMPAGGRPRRASSTAARIAGSASADFEFDRLFEVGEVGRDRGVGASPPREWFLARPRGAELADVDGWQAAYDLYERMRRSPGLAAAGGGPDLIEPDFLQDWGDRREADPAALGVDGAFDPQSPEGGAAVVEGQFAWHLDHAYSELREAARAAANGRPVRIAHLDVGYDRGHVTFPADRIEEASQRNFIDKDFYKDASDRGVTGRLKNPGHGTATLGILAGGRVTYRDNGYDFDDTIGGDPYARIVPVRVGNSVVQIKTSGVARGIAYAAGRLAGDPIAPVDVISMSMGGLASAAWADAVNDAYEVGVLFVAAAGNNFGGLPTRFIVFPARFNRVLAACGVMADGRPYYGLTHHVMQGCWGPEQKMATAMSAYTPNTPWAEKGSGNIVDMDGAGTSSATPQIAAAAALYLRVHGDALSTYAEPWMRVEAVRRALFEGASRNGDLERLGRGSLRAAEALKHSPAAPSDLRKQPRDVATFTFLRSLTGLGAAASPVDDMLRLEATQLLQRWDGPGPNPLEAAVTDPDRADVSPAAAREYFQQLAEHPKASPKLRQRAGDVYASLGGRRVDRKSRPPSSPPNPPESPPAVARPTAAGPFILPEPPYRLLRGYAMDPNLSQSLRTSGLSELTFRVPWEKLPPGPVGEYVEVIDVDPASGCYYEPVDLDAPYLLAQNGLPLSEGTPQFHQQMVYAASMATITNFEHALGRRALWRPWPPATDDTGGSAGDAPLPESVHVPRLRIYPHALREANAYYSPDKIALLFGYFNASEDDAGDHLPNGRVFACLSHDIIAHETTHALLDGMHRRFLLPSNPDVLAFHEAFADVVALLQHFTFPEILRQEIANTQGNIRDRESLFGKLAIQFGRGRGGGQALRDAIGEIDEKTNEWKPRKINPSAYNDGSTEPHDRGVILVAAIFDAFLSIYDRRTAAQFHADTDYKSVTTPGAIHPDLVNRLAGEAAKAAGHVLTMCIRALDYCPPTDITFGEYLRAILTADYDVLKDDALDYRVAFVEAFRRRGIYPRDLRTLDVESLLWRSPAADSPPRPLLLNGILEGVNQFAVAQLFTRDREAIFNQQHAMRASLEKELKVLFQSDEGAADASSLGIDPAVPFTVHSARIAHRAGPDGSVAPRLMLSLLQVKNVSPVQGVLAETMKFEGGATVVADLRSRRVLYCIRKSLASDPRQKRQQAFLANGGDLLRETYLGAGPLQSDQSHAEPFAILHRNV